jgi:short subunit dehydrogenase-like uncharacterized protein
MSKAAAEFDVVVFGASGFTGRLVAEYLAQNYPTGLKWAMAGRNLDKLAAVRAEIGAPASTPLVEADTGNAASLEALCQRTKVVLTTVGPYQLYGTPLVAACAKTGTDYVDLCGEPAWMRQMIEAHDATAKASGARIVFSCGFDSLPSDLGVYLAQKECKARFGGPAPRIKGRVRKMKGGYSGGTAASLKASLEAAAKNPEVLALMKSHFSLTPGFVGPKQPHGMAPEYDEKIGSWATAFVMAAINTRNVHRSNFLLGHAYGQDFVYDEMLLTGPGEKGESVAKFVAQDRSMMSDKGPKPGEGPSKEERESGHFDILFVAEMPDGRSVSTVVTGDRDPGYGSTSKMIAESAVCLVRDATHTKGGIFTAGGLMAEPLMKRLADNAGLTFRVKA